MSRVLVFISFLSLSLTAFAAPKDCEKALLGLGKLRPSVATTIQPQVSKNQSAKASENVLKLTKAVGNRVNPEALESARWSSYRVEVKSRLKLASSGVQVHLDHMINDLLSNALMFDSMRANSKSPEQLALVNAKFELLANAAQLISLGSNRYIGTSPDLVLARDAYARQVETAVRMTSSSSTAKLTEVLENIDFIRAILREKQNNPHLTDAEATARGVEIAYRESFVKRCKDGSCKIPSDDVLAAGAKTRLEEMKDCI